MSEAAVVSQVHDDTIRYDTTRYDAGEACGAVDGEEGVFRYAERGRLDQGGARIIVVVQCEYEYEYE